MLINLAVDLGYRMTETEFGLSILQWEYLVYLVIMFLALLLARQMYSIPFYISLAEQGCWDTKAFSLKAQLVDSDNKAIAISFACWMLAMGMVLVGAMGDLNDLPENNIVTILWTQALGMVLLTIARIINDKLIVRGNGDNVKSLVNNANVAVAGVEGGSILAAGITTMASISGQPTVWEEDLASTALFFVFGQIGFLIFAKLYEYLRGRNAFNVHLQLERKNPAAGLSFGMNLVAIAVLVTGPVLRSTSMIAFWVWYFIGGVILLVMRVIVDKFILPGESLDKEIVDDQNWGAALIEGSTAIMTALVLTSFLRETCATL
eukprot:TRINITY_DN3076_c0_g1_i2.p1 TRINITY_DN3076_c0_g1~~TRINITY_DN3076_c0_g1_i2.p1  ORF type:complete len:320 (+),score=97.14 TRINITY_DN3076_c0_g1_i2:61-1020(+)